MKIAVCTLFGLFSFTIVCPITMGAMPMDMGDMQMSSVVESSEDADGAAPCEQCKKDKEEIAASFGSQAAAPFPMIAPAAFLAFRELPEPLGTNRRILLFANGPPLPTETLVGTVILRT